MWHERRKQGPDIMRVGERPPVEGASITVRLRPAERAKLEELQAHYGLDVSDMIRTSIDVTHRTLTALQAIHGKAPGGRTDGSG